LRNEHLTLHELLRLIEGITGFVMPMMRIPYWLAFIVAAVSEFVADDVTHRSPRASLTGVRLARYTMFFNSDKMINETGFP
jgi:dihydroflavonol-4-reductase